MTLAELHSNFDLEMDKSGIIANFPSFLPEEKDYFFNTAIQRIIKTRYSGVNSHRTGFQQDQKRTDDLRTVVKSIELTSISSISSNYNLANNTYVIENAYEYPDDYFIGLGETVFLSVADENAPEGLRQLGRSDVVECTIENIDSRLTNSLSPYRFHNGMARPLRLYSDGKIYLYTDNNYGIYRYEITYIFMPVKLDWYSTTTTTTTQLSIMPDHMWDEILVYAVKLALQNISDERYLSYSQETQAIE